MGIVPENQHLLGLEGAGVIRRVGKSVKSLKIGQRVMVFEKGTFANRIIATTERVYPLPDRVSFEAIITPSPPRSPTTDFAKIGCIHNAECLPHNDLQSLRSCRYT